LFFDGASSLALSCSRLTRERSAPLAVTMLRTRCVHPLSSVFKELQPQAVRSTWCRRRPVTLASDIGGLVAAERALQLGSGVPVFVLPSRCGEEQR